MIRKWVGARAGLMGNPSDGFGGKTLACLMSNFAAEVTIRESGVIEIVRHPVLDPLHFRTLDHLAQRAEQYGYYGGIRLLLAACKKFHDYCREQGIALPDRHFALQYDTTIPRQVGLGGSSAIITAAIRALLAFYELPEDLIPRPELPNLILAAETEELGIAAGLQDRVIQVYGGLVYMDFNPEYMAAHGHGQYEALPVALLPPLYLAYNLAASESGKVHSPVRYRFEQGEAEVVAAVRTWAELTEEARAALEAGDAQRLGELMDANFDLRRRIYGDQALGEDNLRMVETARSLGLPAKFAGSGGAIVGLCPDPELAVRAAQGFAEQGYCFTLLEPAEYKQGGARV